MNYAIVRNATTLDEVHQVGSIRVVGIWPPLAKDVTWRVFVVQGRIPTRPLSMKLGEVGKKVGGRRVLIEPVEADHPLLVALGIGQSNETYETPGGRTLSDDDIHAFSVEAEIGFDTSDLDSVAEKREREAQSLLREDV